MRDLRIVFMGTPDFAVATLDALIKASFNIIGVITAPDKPAGRGLKMNESAVKKYALKHKLNVLQPTNLKHPEFLDELNLLKPDLQVVVAFRMLPKAVWELPEYGTFNLHASLLPNYRGAAPINWAIINGETKTGVTTFFIDEKIDTGQIILQEEVAIGKDEVLSELYDKLMRIGSQLVVKTVNLIAKGNVNTIKQPEFEEKPAPKLFSETCRIDWNEPLDTIYNLIRGLNPYPAAWTLLIHKNKEIKVKIYDVVKEAETHHYHVGTILSSKKELKVAVPDGFIKIESLKLSGKRKMDSINLLNGFAFNRHDKMQ